MRDRSFATFIICSFLICIPLSFYFSWVNVFMNDLKIANAAAKLTLGQVSDVIFLVLLPAIGLAQPFAAGVTEVAEVEHVELEARARRPQCGIERGEIVIGRGRQDASRGDDGVRVLDPRAGGLLLLFGAEHLGEMLCPCVRGLCLLEQETRARGSNSRSSTVAFSS